MSIIEILKIMEVQEDDMEVQEEAVLIGSTRAKAQSCGSVYLLKNNFSIIGHVLGKVFCLIIYIYKLLF